MTPKVLCDRVEALKAIREKEPLKEPEREPYKELVKEPLKEPLREPRIGFNTGLWRFSVGR